MVLTKKALKAINEKRIRLELALKLDCTEQWVIRLIEANKPNGPLTTHSAIQVIKEHTNLKEDNQILMEPVRA